MSNMPEFLINEDSLLFAIASQLHDEGYMVICFRDKMLHSIRITPAGEGICRLLDAKGGEQ